MIFVYILLNEWTVTEFEKNNHTLETNFFQYAEICNGNERNRRI